MSDKKTKQIDDKEIIKLASSFGHVPKELLPMLKKQYFTSKTQRGECKNNSCTNPRRNSSAFCQACSDNWRKQNG